MDDENKDLEDQGRRNKAGVAGISEEMEMERQRKMK